jgi:hypothetical protein
LLRRLPKIPNLRRTVPTSWNAFRGRLISSKKQIPWLRVLLEGMVIVGSILVAFAIDAAWEGREDSQRREALCAALGNDMALARAEIDRVVASHRTGHGAAADLLNLGPVVPGNDDQRLLIDSLVAATWGSSASYDAPLGAVESVLGSGDLDLLSDPDLVLELTAFPAMVADLAWEQALLQSMSNELQAYLGHQGVDASLFQLNDFDVPWETGPTDSFRLVGEPRLRSLVSMIWYRFNNTISDLTSMREAIARIESHLQPD